MKHKCIICELEFSQKGNRPRKFCSKKCQSVYGTREIICPVCQNKFSVIASSKQLFCNNLCASVGKKSNADALKSTMLAKYGVEHPSQLSDFKIKNHNTLVEKYGDEPYKILSKRCTDAMLKKYGVSRYTNAEKMKETSINKYGVPFYNNRSKFSKTMLERYNSLVSPKTLERTIRDSNNGTLGFKSEKYKKYLSGAGVSNISQLPDIRAKKSVDALKNKYTQLISFPFNTKFKVMFPLEEYRGSAKYEKYPFECLTCNSQFMGCVRNGEIPRCPECFPKLYGDSKFEQDVTEYVKTLVNDTEENTRVPIAPLELDIYIPSQKVAIECDGIFWHSELQGKDKEYHLQKTKLCYDAGIRLIHIFENEWIDKQTIVKSILQTILNPTSNTKIFGRKCEIKELTSIEAAEFLNNNHLQGNCQSSIRLGLIYNDEIVQILTLSKSRYSKQYQWEITRQATKVFTTVVGGTEKLWVHFTKTTSPQSVVTYSDRRYFTGNGYKKLGFQFDIFTTPNYHYTKLGLVESRIKYQKHKLSKILPNFDQILTEWENMQLNGFDRIYDCGHARYVWKSNIV